ncbi:hypothetical protein GXB82_21780 [Pseudomonas stutzeri]|nr:hypothetical protein [Stutzerimonas stutzeri]
MITPKALKGALLLGMQVSKNTPSHVSSMALAQELLKETVTPLTVVALEYLVTLYEQEAGQT